MKLVVHLFAGAREAAGREFVELSLPKGSTAGDLRAALCDEVPALNPYARNLWIAVDGHYAADADVLPSGAELACFPPVSGG